MADRVLKFMGAAMVAAVFAAGAIGASATSPEDDEGCLDRVVWKYCGDRIRLDRPIRFRINQSTRPSGVGASDARLAATLAATEWNKFWPAGARADACFAVCIGSDTGTAFGPNGVSTISWGSTGQCGGADPSGVAVACLYFDADGRIKEVDVVLSSSKTWRAPVAEPVGEVAGLLPAVGGNWYDVQSALTHEFGHAIGLDDIGADRPWPYDLSDTVKYQQTMYGYYYPGSTNKRTLAEGDIAGLQEVAARAVLDQ